MSTKGRPEGEESAMEGRGIQEFALRAYHRVVPPRIDREIQRALALPQDRFPGSLNLPRVFGRRMNERVVEILVARLTYRPGAKILDVGHANIMNAHARMLKSLAGPVDITGIDITPADDSIRSLYTRSIVGDVAKTEFPEGCFDLVWCISAIEHFGMDNALYTSRFALDTDLDLRALQEMMRVLRTGGMLYLSVPFGKYEDHGWLRNYDRDRWQRLLGVARPGARIDELYFGYSDARGWSCVPAEELSGVGYDDHRNSGASGLAIALLRKGG